MIAQNLAGNKAGLSISKRSDGLESAWMDCSREQSFDSCVLLEISLSQDALRVNITK